MGKKRKPPTQAPDIEELIRDDIEELIRDARRRARAQGVMFPLAHPVSGAHIANVWPDGKVDATVEGQRVISTREPGR
jgi:hypothetical protein